MIKKETTGIQVDTNLGDRILWCRDTTVRLIILVLLPVLFVVVVVKLLLIQFFEAIICWIPGGFGAQFGLPWFGIDLVNPLVLIDILLLLSLLLLLLLLLLMLLMVLIVFLELLLLLVSIVVAKFFANNDDLFGTIEIFVPFTGVDAFEVVSLKKKN